MKHTKHKLLSSIATLMICFAMFIGSTYAWFTDSASTGVNKIQAGNLDIEVKHVNSKVTVPTTIEGSTELFRDKNGEKMKWEPGAVSYETFTVANKGTLALKYNLKLHINDYNAIIDSENVRTLKDVLKVKVLTEDQKLPVIDRANVHQLGWTSNDQSLESFTESEGKLYPEGSAEGDSEDVFQVIVYWMPTDMDNYWNVNNGKTTSDGEPLFIDFGIDVAATQLEHESDSFDNTYDKDLIIADLPKNISKKFESKPLLLQSGANSYNITDTVQVLNKSTNTVVANMPGEAASAVGNALKATIQDKANDSDLETTIIFDIKTTTATANSVVYNIEATALAVYTDTNGTKQTKEFTAAETDSALTSAGKITVVPLEIGKGLTSVSITHNDTVMNPLRSADVDEEGYFYNPLTGELLIKSITFSPFSIEFDGTSEVVATVNGQNYAKLQYAVMAAKEATDPVTITVKKTVDEVAEFDSTYESKNIVLDLGGNRISGFTAFGGNITVKNGTITGRTNVYDSSDVTLAIDVTVSNYVVVWGDGTYGNDGCKTPTLNVYGKIANATEYASITTNGTDLSKPVINVYNGANITHQTSIAIYLPSGKLNVSGGTITGATGIYFKSTDINISGGTITGNGDKQDYDYNGNGANATGDALVIDNCNYPAGIGTVSVSGGTFISTKAKTVGSYAGNDQTNALSGFITGGFFTDKPDYLAPEYKAVLNANSYYEVSRCENHHYVDGECEHCGKLQETWLNIENAMTEAPEGFSISENNVAISSNNGFAWFAKQVNAGTASFANNSKLTVTLSADIDLMDYPWTPINGFTGTFDGSNHTISNLYYHDNATSGQGFGLFGISNGQIKNLTIQNAHVMGNSACGAFVGQGNGLLENLKLTGKITIGTTTNQGHLANFNSSYIGGIRGNSFRGKIRNCTVIGDENSIIGGGRQVGGILGFDTYGYPDSVVNCTVTNIKVIGGKSVGGVVGWANSTGIQNCSITNVMVELTNASEPETIGLISGTSRCLINDTETTVYENNTADSNSRLIVNGETPSVDDHPVLRLYSPYSSDSYVTLADGKYMFTCYGVTKAMTKGDNITLLHSFSESITIPSGKNITIDLNGNELLGSFDTPVIMNNGTLTIKNGTVYGTISGDNVTKENITEKEPICIAMIGDAKFSTLAKAIATAGNQDVIKLTQDINETVEVENGKIVTIDLNGYELSGTTYYTIDNYGTLTIKDSQGDGEVIGTSYTIYNNEGGSLNVEDHATVRSTISDTGYYGISVYNEGMLHVSGGRLLCANDDQWYHAPIYNDNGICTISGGTFTKKPKEGFIAENYIAQQNSDGTWTVIPENVR